jgi:RNA polymerase primary sigma factor
MATATTRPSSDPFPRPSHTDTTPAPALDSADPDALLSAAEERSLALAVKSGDANARTRFIRANLRLVVRIARDYRGRGLPIDDLVAEGNLGLIRAVDLFDPSRGTRFSTYASHWIRQAIREALLNTAPRIRLPAYMALLLSRWRRAADQIASQIGRDPTFDEVSDFLALRPLRRSMVRHARVALRWVKPGDDSAGLSPLDELAARDDSPGDSLERQDAELRLLYSLQRLEWRARYILVRRFGLDGQEPESLSEIGQTLGVTRECVRKAERRALNILAQALRPSDQPTALTVPFTRRELPSSSPTPYRAALR